MTINLAKYTNSKSMLLSGRPKGKQVRTELRLDVIDGTDEVVEVMVPDHILTVNSSFFLGLFGESVRRLSPDGFRAKYRFVGRTSIDADITRGIRDAIEDSTPLG